MRPFFTFLPIVWLALAGPIAATPARYALEAQTSTVRFETDFGKDHITGQMPITKADLTLDFDRVANCKVAVVLDASGATASFPFAAQALKGPKVLDTNSYPQIVFKSTSVKAAGKGARITGMATIRGVSRPMVLKAQIYRPKGADAGDHSRLSVRLTGVIHRSDFGATGWSDMVGDDVRLDILARIVRVN